MDLSTKPKYFEPQPIFTSHEVQPLEDNANMYRKNPFADNIENPLCNFNLKETSEFVEAFPMGNNSLTERSLIEAPCTPGRPIFSFSSGNVATKKCFPSKWDDAEKWLNGNSSCNESPAHNVEKGLRSKPQAEVLKGIHSIQNSVYSEHQVTTRAFHGVSPSTEAVLKDKFTSEVEPAYAKLICSDPMKEGFFFGKLNDKHRKDEVIVTDVKKHRDIGTEMTPLGSSTTSRCPTPFMSTSPIRNNTPTSRSGPLALTDFEHNNPAIDMNQFNECHLAKMQIESQFNSVVTAWSSKEEEEEDISKSLRHFEFSNECRRSVSESKATKWEEEEENKCCLRYQREEARIQAWVNLQNAKAEAQSKKLEVKILKMRTDLEEKQMKRMAVVHRKAEEWRANAQFQQSDQIQKATKQALKNLNRPKSHFLSQKSMCSCFNNHM